MTTKNLIFDLGGVIIDLGFPDMVNGFAQLGIANFEQYFTPLKQQKSFEELELGNLSEQEFYDNFRRQIAPALTNEQIRSQWNLILKAFNPERMALLQELAQSYQLYLFSNTNAIHAQKFEADCLVQMGQPLNSYFKSLYYSHDLHLRKPDPAAFSEVLKRANLKAAETLFIDDNAANIAGAQAVGLQTYHLKAPQESILDLNFAQIAPQA